MRDFPNRTETDLYAWILQHQEHLKDDLGWNLEPSVVATDIADWHSNNPGKLITRVTDRIKVSIIPEIYRTGPHTTNVDSIRQKFEKHCHDVGLPGELAVDTGQNVPTICKHARLSDLVIIYLAHPPEDHPIMRAESGIRKLIQLSAIYIQEKDKIARAILKTAREQHCNLIFMGG